MNKIGNSWTIDIGDPVYKVICGALSSENERKEIHNNHGHVHPKMLAVIQTYFDDVKLIDAVVMRVDDKHIVMEFVCKTLCSINDVIIPLEHIQVKKEIPREVGLVSLKQTIMVHVVLLILTALFFCYKAYAGTVGEGTVLLPHHKIMSETPYIKPYSDAELHYMAQNLYFEERSSIASDIDIAQIGYVVLNRVKKRHWPNTIKEVIWEKKWSSKYKKWVPMFSWTLDGLSDEMVDADARARSYYIAHMVLTRQIPNLVGDADHYLNKYKSKAVWWKTMEFKGRYGDHWFYTR